MDGGTITALQTVTTVIMLAVTAGALLLLCRLAVLTRRLEKKLRETSGKEIGNARTL